MTSTQSPRACRAPVMTALPRPPFREPGGRCRRRIGTGQVTASSASTSGVPSSLSSTKMSSASSGATAGPSRASSSSMLCFSLRVGTITVSLGVSPLPARPRSTSASGKSASGTGLPAAILIQDVGK